VTSPAISEALVTSLVAEQFPEWSDLPVQAVVPGGNDHRTFRLGDRLSVRLPSAPGYVPQVVKEQTWLPKLGPAVPLPIPAVHGAGRASTAFPAPWSVYGWLDGEPAQASRIEDPVGFAADLAAFLVALRSVDAAAGPAPGLHSAWARGRGWALWKALIMLTNKPPGQAELARHVLEELLADPG
jgi:aminoglycoside phosphotransferase (APT) family kinase protein